MKAYGKTVVRTVKSNFARFIAITAVVLLGTAFVSGLGALPPVYEDTISEYFVSSQGADFVVKTESETGFSDEQLSSILDTDGVEKTTAFTSFDTASEAVSADGYNARIYYTELNDDAVNPFVLTEGKKPENSSQVLVDRYTLENTGLKIGDKIKLGSDTIAGFSEESEICGVVENPLVFTKEGEPDLINEENLELIVYVDASVTELYVPYATPVGEMKIPLPVTDVYVKASGVEGMNIFSKDYADITNAVKERIEAIDESFTCLTTRENYSCALTEEYSDKINVVAVIFPIFFIVVAGLVVLTTMTRLIEEERSVIGCYKTLGYSNLRIALKYMGFSLTCCVLGALIGVFAGVWILPAVIFPAFDVLFFFPTLVLNLHVNMGLITAAIMTAVIVAVTAYVVLSDLKTKPADLLKPKSPKPGKKIFLEHVPFIWKRLKFKYKSTYRNVFRYVKHLIMTVISVAGSTALVLAGFGLRDVSLDDNAGFIAGFSDTFALISTVIILFAAALCILVIYNLTNMNIGERKREIATLKVLGYRDIEVSGYIYREVLIMSIFGIIIGLPLGFGLLYFLFEYLGFGDVSMIKWYSYVISAALTLVFVGFVDLLLHRKIRKIDMNDSLKTLE